MTRRRVILLYLLYRHLHRQQSGRIRRYYIRSAHDYPMGSRFRIFFRYYNSEDPEDLVRFFRFRRQDFDELFDLVKDRIRTRALTHRYPITKI